MKLKIYQADAFTNKLFSGNPAAVCPLNEWIDDDIMQKIAMENNLAETAFYVKKEDIYELRWFTPTMEVDLCGHATLASAFVLFNYENHMSGIIQFFSHRSGNLTVTKKDNLLTLNFPSDQIEPIEITHEVLACFDLSPKEAYIGKSDLLLIYNCEKEILNLQPEMEKIRKIDVRGIIVSSKGDTTDFVSRFFAPQSGVDEDPVTGSAHTTLTPYWSKKLGKKNLSARQLSKRGGELHCMLLNDRVEISGECKLYLTGEIYI
jgi:PhzF family phenazine biosynthesis protein